MQGYLEHMKKKDRPDAGLQLWQLVVTVVLLLIFGTLAVILLAIGGQQR